VSLLVVTGPPGAGKSTVARLLADRFDRSVLVAGDAFFGFLARGLVDPWLPEADPQNEIVARAAASATGHFSAGGYATVYDGVVGPWSLPAFAAATGLESLGYVILLPPVELCVERVLTRRNHGFGDEAATRRMHRQFAEAAIPARHVLHDPPRAPAAVADLVSAELARKTLEYSPGRTG
jgi:AAA domain-containing protein